MFRGLMAVLLLAVPTGAASGQSEKMGEWQLARMSNGCMVQATSPQGTMLSIWGFAGQPNLGFLLQNREWDSLRDGERYRLSFDFAGLRSLPVVATAREHIDSDGPGFFFSLEPGAASGTNFLDAFSSAEGMDIRQNGQKVDTLPLAGSRGAMGALARCLSERWGGADPAEAIEANAAEAEGAKAETI